jgi:phosphoribosylformylglycinamidine synthase subunit PurL
VSLYNDAPAGPIYPTPVVGIVGRLPDATRAGRLGFADEGDLIAIVGPFDPSLAGSEPAKLRGSAPEGPLPPIDAATVRAAHERVRDSVRAGMFSSAHDIAEGGIAVALAECCIAGGIGASVQLPEGLDPFGEAPGQGFIVSGGAAELAGLRVIGRVGGSELDIEGVTSAPVEELSRAWSGGLTQLGA